MSSPNFQRVDFDRHPERPTVGRNGLSYAKAIEVDTYPANGGFSRDVVFSNVNSKDITTRAAITCPAEKIPDLIEALRQLDGVPPDPRLVACRRYSDALDELGLPPNGDDFNALLDFLEGRPYHEPHEDGR